MALKVSNTRILPVSYYDDGVILTATTQATNFPATRLLNNQPRETWRSTVLSQQTLVFDPQRDVILSGIYLGNLNATIDAQLTITISKHPSFAAGNLLYQWTGNAIDPIFGLGEDNLGVQGLGGFSDDGWQYKFNMHWLQSDSLLNNAEIPLIDHCFVKIELTDAQNPDGYMEIGRFMAGQAFAPDRDIDLGVKLGWNHNSQLIRTRGGALRSNTRAPFRELDFTWTFLEEVDALEYLEMVRAASVRKGVVVSVWPEQTTTTERIYTIYGRIIDASAVETVDKWINAGTPDFIHRVSMSFQEAL